MHVSASHPTARALYQAARTTHHCTIPQALFLACPVWGRWAIGVPLWLSWMGLFLWLEA